jgi:hypothetical protein
MQDFSIAITFKNPSKQPITHADIDSYVKLAVQVVGESRQIKQKLIVSSPHPINDAARIYSEIIAQQVPNANI